MQETPRDYAAGDSVSSLTIISVQLEVMLDLLARFILRVLLNLALFDGGCTLATSLLL